VAGLIRERLGIDVVMTPSTRTGEFSVWVDGRRVINKLLPMIRPSDAKVLAAVELAHR
jgi:hypothetical protein